MQRHTKVKFNPANDDLIFQVLNWSAGDEEIEASGSDDDSIDSDNSYKGRSKAYSIPSRYLIKVYGATEDCSSVSVNIMDFTPFFYIRVDHKISHRFLQSLREYMVTNMPWKLKESILGVKFVKRKDFWGFTNFQEFTFVRLTFTNLSGYRAGIRLFQKDIRVVGYQQARYKLYESNIEPFLRFMHVQELLPAGWCRIPAGKYRRNGGVLETSCQIDVECDWKEVLPYESERNAPFIVASFDIECTSSHGDFPVAKKDYRKTANELVTFFIDQVDKMEESELTELIQSELVAMFSPTGGGKHLSRVYPKRRDNGAIAVIVEKNIVDIMNMLRCEVIYRGANAHAPDHTAKEEDDGNDDDRDGDDNAEAQGKTKKKINREYLVGNLTNKFGTYREVVTGWQQKQKQWNGIFPQLNGDHIIQIGTTVHLFGEKECCYKNIITLNTCDPIEGVDVVSCETEEELLLAWRDLIVRLDPDIMIGYNIFGFDMAYLYERADEKGIARAFSQIGRVKEKECKFEEKSLSSSALGDNILKFIDADGRVLIDIMKVVQRDHKLDSFKLDNVAHHFIGLKKNDVHPNDIFRLQKGSSADRKVVAEYCVQDCELCNRLLMKLEILANNIGMANVCTVPLSYIFLRGQGIKIFSLVAKECRKEGYLIPTIFKPRFAPGAAAASPVDGALSVEEDGYEGAIVLEPKTGIYIDDPICILDYASLYPSSMISENLSHDCMVIDSQYDNLPDVEYLDICYDVYEGVGDKKQKVSEKVCRFVQLPNNEKGIIPKTLQKLLRQRKETRKKAEWKTVTCKATSDKTSDKTNNVYRGLVNDSEPGILRIACDDGSKVEVRTEDVESIEDTYDAFQKAVLDGLQVAYKVTANSLYGQVGARTSNIYMKEIAACTTATGRKMIMLAKDYIEKNNEGAEIIYGDTDSLFIKFTIKDEQGNIIKGKDAIPKVRELGISNSKAISKILKHPHDLEWEKIFYPFILLSKKRYVANKYEHDDHKHKQNSMGIVLKRRDNANIVKKIYGGIINTILNEHDVHKSIEFLQEHLQNLAQGNYSMEDLVISKSLRADYKDPDRIAHKMLADRIKERDPGNAPNVNDRIPYVYVKIPEKPKGEKTLQGERIETPEYIKDHNLQPDFEFYITNQIMKPILQVYALVLDQLPGYPLNAEYWQNKYAEVLLAKNNNEKKTRERIDTLREQEVKKLLFQPILDIISPPKPKAPRKTPIRATKANATTNGVIMDNVPLTVTLRKTKKSTLPAHMIPPISKEAESENQAKVISLPQAPQAPMVPVPVKKGRKPKVVCIPNIPDIPDMPIEKSALPPVPTLPAKIKRGRKSAIPSHLIPPISKEAEADISSSIAARVPELPTQTSILPEPDTLPIPPPPQPPVAPVKRGRKPKVVVPSDVGAI